MGWPLRQVSFLSAAAARLARRCCGFHMSTQLASLAEQFRKLQRYDNFQKGLDRTRPSHSKIPNVRITNLACKESHLRHPSGVGETSLCSNT